VPKDTFSPTRLDFLIGLVGLKNAVQVLDVGANPIEGEVSYQGLLNTGHAQVVGFEPQADALAALNERKSDAETYLPHALGDGKKHKLRVYQGSGFASLFGPDTESSALMGFAKDMQVIDEIPVSTKKLDSLKDVPPVDFLKIDVQGAETSIINHGTKKLKDALVVQTEVRMFPLYDAEPRYGDLEKALTDQGFEFLQFVHVKHVALAKKYKKRIKYREFAQAVDGDAYFVRDLRKIEDYSNDQLRKLAVLADGVMRCWDLTLFALDQLRRRGVVEEAGIDAYIEHLPDEVKRS